jgi:hypothetical protein
MQYWLVWGIVLLMAFGEWVRLRAYFSKFGFIYSKA